MYEIEIKRAAEKDMRRLPKGMFRRIRDSILALRDQPRPDGVRKLAGGGMEGCRIRIGDYRVVYQIDDAKNRITIIRVRHRREVYR